MFGLCIIYLYVKFIFLCWSSIEHIVQYTYISDYSLRCMQCLFLIMNNTTDKKKLKTELGTKNKHGALPGKS
jgi:hypothetical protein